MHAFDGLPGFDIDIPAISHHEVVGGPAERDIDPVRLGLRNVVAPAYVDEQALFAVTHARCRGRSGRCNLLHLKKPGGEVGPIRHVVRFEPTCPSDSKSACI